MCVRTYRTCIPAGSGFFQNLPWDQNPLQKDSMVLKKPKLQHSSLMKNSGRTQSAPAPPPPPTTTASPPTTTACASLRDMQAKWVSRHQEDPEITELKQKTVDSTKRYAMPHKYTAFLLQCMHVAQ